MSYIDRIPGFNEKWSLYVVLLVCGNPIMHSVAVYEKLP